jgi:hypothetical protein
MVSSLHTEDYEGRAMVLDCTNVVVYVLILYIEYFVQNGTSEYFIVAVMFYSTSCLLVQSATRMRDARS